MYYTLTLRVCVCVSVSVSVSVCACVCVCVCIQAGLTVSEKSIANCFCNTDKRFAFIEMNTVDEAAKCMEVCVRVRACVRV
jgi:hypothetical protein